MTRIFRRLGLLALIIKAGLPANAALRAGLVLDAANYLRTFELEGPPPYYTGPPNPGLDFLSANLIHVPIKKTLTFTSAMARTIFGLIDRG